MTFPPDSNAVGQTCPPRKTPSPRRDSPRWTRAQIQAARRASLPELLSARGFHLRETGAENYHVHEHPGIIVKRSFWREVDSGRAGNAIDFLVEVLGMTFHQAMQEISQR